jgi:hypothetical protein
MEITKKRKQFYKEIGVDIKKLKPYYINRAKLLLKYYSQYNDDYSNEMKRVLSLFIQNSFKELKDIIEEIKIPPRVGHNSFGIHNTEFDVFYVNADLIERVLDKF